MAVGTFDQVMADPNMLAALGGGGGPAPRFVTVLWPFARPFLKKDKAAYLRLMAGFLDSLKTPPHQRPAFDLGAQVRALPVYCVLTRMVMPALDRTGVEDARHRARLDTCLLGVALKLFKAKRGAYPDQLAQLMPECLAKLPDDPFSGQPYRYVKKGDGFVVYSLGSNRQDDGGVEDPKNRDKGDIVFEVTK
jgi:hypothetical protein